MLSDAVVQRIEELEESLGNYRSIFQNTDFNQRATRRQRCSLTMLIRLLERNQEALSELRFCIDQGGRSLSVKYVATILAVSKGEVYGLLKRGKLKWEKVRNRRVGVNADSFLQFCRCCRNSG